MHAELVIDLHELGTDVGTALDRDDTVLPALGQVAAMWKVLGVDVTAMHVIVPGYSVRSSGQPSFSELHAKTWWETESAFLDDGSFDVHLVLSAVGDVGPVGQKSLVVTTALRRSDQLAAEPSQDDSIVIVMTNAAEASVAVSHARGVPVMVAGTAMPESPIAHARLDPAWMAMLANRFARLSLPEVERRNGRPWVNGAAICTPMTSTLGRDESVATIPTFTESIVIHDPEFFSVAGEPDDFAPDASGVATVVEVLGMGELVHVEGPLEGSANEALVETTLVASMYRLATDHPNTPIIIASGRPGLVVVASDLDAYSLVNARRFLRLCLPSRKSTFNEETFGDRTMAARVVLERSLSEPLFAEEDSSVHSMSLNETNSGRSSSPTLVLFTNLNNTRELSQEWRHSTGRRFLMLGSEVTEAVPADEPYGDFLPVSLGGSTDFALRRPDLQPGSIVEGILDTARERWIILSDPVERRAVARAVILRDDNFAVDDAA